MTLARMQKDNIKKNLDFVIYNYLAATENITAEKMIQDFRLVYDINLTQEEVNRILDEYAKVGVLSPRFRHFVFVSR